MEVMGMEIVIDRFEGDFAVCEKSNREMINVEKSRIPSEAKEGSVLIVSDSGDINVDIEKTKQREEEIKKLAEDIWN
jgi:Protein of unknown function (DUF3006).